MADSMTRRIFPGIAPITDGLAPLAELLLRVMCGLWLLPHGWFKVTVMGFDKVSAMMKGFGMPSPDLFAAGAIGIELIAGVLLAIGLLTRLAAAFVFVEMAVVTFAVHWANGFPFTVPHGGWEYPAMWTLLSLYFVLRGGGRYSVDALIGREI